MEPVRDADEAALSDEIALNRVLLHRLLLSLQEQDEAPPQEVARIARLVLSGGRAVARLLREERALSGEEADSVAAAIDRALDELALEWGVEL